MKRTLACFVLLVAVIFPPLCVRLGRSLNGQNPQYKLDLPADFGLAEAMTSIYGQYDAAKGSSTAATPPGVPDQSSFLRRSGRITVRPFFAGAVEEQQTK
jgi:hypothetical protein